GVSQASIILVVHDMTWVDPIKVKARFYSLLWLFYFQFFTLFTVIPQCLWLKAAYHQGLAHENAHDYNFGKKP
ncbi:hypothetical protein, partial [Jeotgalibaca porci]|uniref:hypothetical protein n=1 Tax=Jeotgalibaca porci TaxID=1868793 RepID=UPI0035A135F9